MTVKRVSEVPYGVYMWKMDNGSYMADSDRNFLSISSTAGDLRMMAAIRKTAHAYLRGMGMDPEGSPEFFSGHRKVSDSEYYEQIDRMADGQIPDELDVAAYAEELRDQKNGG